MKKIIGLCLITAGIFLATYVVYAKYVTPKTQPFSTYTVLSSSWEKYKASFINPDGRVIDYSNNGITTSEGQSYAMLRAVWSDDKATFDKAWEWTQTNLNRPNDELFGWHWGKKDDGSYGFLKNGGDNSASDADSDIALALVLAGRRWNDDSYTKAAKKMLPDLWKLDTTVIQGKRYMTAGNWADGTDKTIINVSYFAPYAWREFAKIDKARDWNSLVTPAYDLLAKVGTMPLDRGKGVGLAPDWIEISKSNGDILHSSIPGTTSDYSYDAVRVPWRVAVDYVWNKEPKAKTYLETCCTTLTDAYKKDGKLTDRYQHDGSPIGANENPTMYGTFLGALIVTNPELAKNMYTEKIIQLYSNDTNGFKDTIPYYEQNWLWFGAALYNNQIIPFSS